MLWPSAAGCIFYFLLPRSVPSIIGRPVHIIPGFESIIPRYEAATPTI